LRLCRRYEAPIVIAMSASDEAIQLGASGLDASLKLAMMRRERHSGTLRIEMAGTSPAMTCCAGMREPRPRLKKRLSNLFMAHPLERAERQHLVEAR
jgi:hypothetical protein